MDVNLYQTIDLLKMKMRQNWRMKGQIAVITHGIAVNTHGKPLKMMSLHKIITIRIQKRKKSDYHV